MATETAPDEGQGPCSGRSRFEDRAGFAQQCARRQCCASHEAATCAPAQVKSGPETHAVDVSRSRGRTEARLEIGIWIGRVLQASVCVKLCVACAVRSVRRACKVASPMRYAYPGLREKSRGFGVRVTSSGIPRHGLRASRAHVLVWGTPRNARLACDAQ